MDFDPLPQQRLAIEAPKGPVLVVAGPGAGKTFCLTRRVQYLIETLGFDPARICAVTFTNRAAEEIAARLTKTIGPRADEITRGTLHAFCLGILRDHVEAAGLRAGFGIADDVYQRIVLGRLNVPAKWRGRLLGLFGRRRLQQFGLTKGDERLFREYGTYLTRRNLLDFDDLIVTTARLLERRGDIADALAARWDYLLVDEVQDLNGPQYEIVKRLAAPHRNVFAVGDDEQSIFSWTGADPRVLVRFREDFQIADPIVLDRNCRCSRQIFETARRVLAENPQLFDKRLTADRPSDHDVRAYAFADEEAEANWLIDDMRADRAAAGLRWGDYAVLYRQHRVGEYLEGRLLNAEIPCRLARGRSIVEDSVVGYVIAALRVLRDPADPVAVEALARLVFSEHLMQDVGAAIQDADAAGVLEAVRRLARRRPGGDPDTKKLWRFVYQIENLGALARSDRSLSVLVEELLSQSVGPYRNTLEERHDELSDPASLPDARKLAQRLAAAIAAERRVVIEPMQGLEVALRGMLVAAGGGLRRAPADPGAPQEGDVTIGPGDAGPLGLSLTVFKALQLLQAPAQPATMDRYVTFDLETTDNDVEGCDVIEVGAARVVRGEVVDRYHTLVRPSRSISPRATKVHGYADADVQDAPPFAEVWPAFRAFVGSDVLVAHNGLTFDVPVLRRLAAPLGGVGHIVFYDTLPLARSLSRAGAKLGDLAARFGIDGGRAHHALDDAVTLAAVFQQLERQRAVRARKAVLVNLLDYLGLALALETPAPAADEAGMLLGVAKYYTLGRYGEALEFYAAERERSAGAPSVEDVVTRLGGAALMARLNADTDPAQRYPAAVARLRALMDGSPPGALFDAIDRLLERVALSTWAGAEVAPDRVNLLTLHSTKGLEFSRVYVLGVEDYQLPGFYAMKDHREDEIQEARRLLYVGMTRARDRLVLTRVKRRFGMEAGGSGFLEEMGLPPSELPQLLD